MKKTFLKSLAGIAAVAFAVSCTAPAPKYKTVVVDAPFAMEPIKECVFPEQDFSIVDYGAVKGGETVNTEAIAKAIAACNKACLLYTSPSPRDGLLSRMPSSA